MGLLGWIIIGGIAGAIAKAIMKDSFGLITTIIVGIVGGVIGGWIMNAIGGQGIEGFSIYSLFVAVIGAVVLLAVLGIFKKKA